MPSQGDWAEYVHPDTGLRSRINIRTRHIQNQDRDGVWMDDIPPSGIDYYQSRLADEEERFLAIDLDQYVADSPDNTPHILGILHIIRKRRWMSPSEVTAERTVQYDNVLSARRRAETSEEESARLREEKRELENEVDELKRKLAASVIPKITMTPVGGGVSVGSGTGPGPAVGGSITTASPVVSGTYTFTSVNTTAKAVADQLTEISRKLTKAEAKKALGI